MNTTRAVTDPVAITRPSALWVIAGTGLIALAGWLLGSGVGDDFVPFLLCLLGGWMCGYFVAGFLLGDGGWRRIGSMAAVAVVLSVGAWSLIGPLAEHVGSLPLMARSAVLAVQFASLTGVGWLWLVTFSALSQQTKRSTEPLMLMEWQHDGQRSWLIFQAIRMSLLTLAWSITTIVVAGGLGVAGILIATGDQLLFAGPRLMIILLGAVFGIPAYFVLVLVLRRRQVTVTAEFHEGLVTVAEGDARTELSLNHVAQLVWGGSGEYSRVLMRTTSGHRLSLVAGIAKVPRGHAAGLPPLPRSVLRQLQLAGLVEKKASSKPNAPKVFERAV